MGTWPSRIPFLLMHPFGWVLQLCLLSGEVQVGYQEKLQKSVWELAQTAQRGGGVTIPAGAQ